MNKSFLLVTVLALNSLSVHAEPATAHAVLDQTRPLLDMSRPRAMETVPADGIRAGTIVWKKVGDQMVSPHFSLKTGEVFKLVSDRLVTAVDLKNCEDGLECLLDIKFMAKDGEVVAMVDRRVNEKAEALRLGVPIDSHNKRVYLDGVPREDMIRFNPEIVALFDSEMAGMSPQIFKIDLAGYKMVYVDGLHFGSSAKDFVSLDPKTIVLVSPKYDNHGGIHAVGPIFLAGQSMGVLQTDSWALLGDKSNARNRISAKAVITQALHAHSRPTRETIVMTKGGDFTLIGDMESRLEKENLERERLAKERIAKQRASKQVD